MLIITRREGEKLMIGDDVVITVVEVNGGTIRLGIDAPRALPVYREELWAAVRDENRAAAAAPVKLPELPAKD
jgi:carbon storage regulator